MSKKRIIEVKGIPISIHKEDYISLSDIANGFEGGTGLIEKWIRNKNTIEYLAVWESLYNPDFNSPEFEGIKMEAGTNRFMMSAKQWIQKTNAIGITASAGRYGGTYAHEDIATEFCSWLSPEFKLYLIREFQRLKKQEAALQNEEWNFKRALSKVNYKIHTDAIKDNILPILHLPKDQQSIVYASEADILNMALFGMTSKDWKLQNPDLAIKGHNIRDYADLHQLTVLSNLESYNAIMISQNVPQDQRLIELNRIAISQLKTLRSMTNFALDKLKSPNLKILEKLDK
ncbi:MAG: KilA-N domain-containing protein [Saprospiraceae bacterium]|nr:KilA-N domain-containing protein [Saprospiraceae bacterium]